MKKLIFLLSIFALGVVGALDASARYKGDLNGDDRVDLADMVYLAKAIKAGSTDKALDMNASGKVDDYDLHRLADLIISASLTSDEGMNAGIEGWEESEEDYGGIVRTPALTTRSAEDTRFYIRDPKWDYDEVSSVEFGISYGGDWTPYAVLISVWMPVDCLNQADPVQLCESVLKTHRIYGTPKMVKQKYNEDWSPLNIRFIVFSPEVQKMNLPDGKLGRILYSASPSEYYTSCYFYYSQIISGDDMNCVELPDHDSGFYGSLYTGVESIISYDAPCDIYSANGQLLRKNVPHSEIQNLERGLYIIRQRGKTTKLLK